MQQSTDPAFVVRRKAMGETDEKEITGGQNKEESAGGNARKAKQ